MSEHSSEKPDGSEASLFFGDAADATKKQEAEINRQAWRMKTAAEVVEAARVAFESVNTAAIGDAANSRDALGFGAYVKAVAAFLTSPDTKPPLTFSLEGEWGSGKSSFMLQLRDSIRSTTGPHSYIVEFNAWRYEKEEALWAAFALTFVQSLRRQMGFFAGLWASLALLRKRLDKDEGIYRLLRTVALLAAIVIEAAWLLLQGPHWLHVAPFEQGWWGPAVGVLAVAGLSLRQAWQQIGSPFERDLRKYFDSPDYRKSRAFIESFSDDFAKIVSAYIRKDDRIFVFIDDLDRCEMPRAGDLLQALNLMLPAGEDLPIVYILGMDRQMVCAGVAATFEKQLPYLYPAITDPTERSLVAGELAWNYVDKFVQVPFRMPLPTLDSIKRYVASVTEPAGAAKQPERAQYATTETTSTVSIAPLEPIDVVSIAVGTESESVRQVVEMVAPLFNNNPRRVKQFLNVFRLQVHIASETGLFRQRESPAKNLTLPKFAKITAIFLRYPALASRLREKPELLAALQRHALAAGAPTAGNDDPEVRRYTAQPALMRLLACQGDADAYRLDELDISGLLTTVPAQPRAQVNAMARAMARANDDMFEGWDELASET